MNAKHWTADSHETDHGPVHDWAIRDNEGILVAWVQYESHLPLIAAAPDLLAALREMLDWQPGREYYTAVRDRARAAISKAEGE